MTDDASTRRTSVRLFAWGRHRDSSILIDTAFLIRSLRMLDSNASGTIIFVRPAGAASRSEEHTSELQSLMRTSYAVFCLKNTTTDKLKPQQQPRHRTPLSQESS